MSEKDAWVEGFLAAHYADLGHSLPAPSGQEVPAHLVDLIPYWNPYDDSVTTDPHES